MADVEKSDSKPGDEKDNEELGEEEEVEAGERTHVLIEDLPIEVRRRVRALKKNQLEVTKIEANFFQEMHTLECKYLPLYQPLFKARQAIIAGDYEPNDEECEFSLGSDSESGLDVVQQMNQANLEDGSEKKESVSGIPNFWAHIFRNVELLADITEDYDLPILKHLVDIQVEMTESPMGFKLNFHFSPNEYFTNSVLTKTYDMKCDLDAEDPFSFEGPEIVKCSGCTIDWVKGKNVTVKTIRKKQKHKQRGSIRTVSKTVEVPSFFNFFNPPQVPDSGDDEMDEETQMKLTNDFEVGQYIRERIVPRAVLYFTGEALEDEEDEFDDEEEEEEEEDDEDDVPAIKGAKNNKNRKRDITAKPNPECKQQ